jgi:hypothetical protein
MIDPKLEKELEDCRKLATAWRKFHDFFAIGVKGTDIAPDKEAAFLENKSSIAMLHDSFMEALTHDQNIGQNVMGIIARCITLRHVSRLSVAEIKKIEIEWHESYLLLNETIGYLEEKKENLASVSNFQYTMSNFRKNLALAAQTVAKSIYTKIILIILAVVFVVWGIPTFGIYDYHNLKNYRYTEALYYAFMDFYREYINSSTPYDRIQDFKWDEKKTPGISMSIKTDYTRKQIVDLIYGYPLLNISNDLMNAQEFQFATFRIGRNSTDAHMFLFTTIGEAEDVLTKYQKWVESVPSYEKNNPASTPNLTTAFRKINMVIFLRSTNRDVRTRIKSDVFKVL